MPWDMGEDELKPQYEFEPDGQQLVDEGPNEAIVLRVVEERASTGKDMLVVDVGVIGAGVKVRDRVVRGHFRFGGFLAALGESLPKKGQKITVDGKALSARHANKTTVGVVLVREQEGEYAGRLRVDRYMRPGMPAEPEPDPVVEEGILF